MEEILHFYPTALYNAIKYYKLLSIQDYSNLSCSHLFTSICYTVLSNEIHIVVSYQTMIKDNQWKQQLKQWSNGLYYTHYKNKQMIFSMTQNSHVGSQLWPEYKKSRCYNFDGFILCNSYNEDNDDYENVNNLNNNNRIIIE